MRWSLKTITKEQDVSIIKQIEYKYIGGSKVLGTFLQHFEQVLKTG